MCQCYKAYLVRNSGFSSPFRLDCGKKWEYDVSLFEKGRRLSLDGKLTTYLVLTYLKFKKVILFQKIGKTGTFSNICLNYFISVFTHAVLYNNNKAPITTKQ